MPATQYRTPPRVNYLNNRDLLKQIHLSKNTYCVFRDPVQDHQFDIILESVGRINQRTVAEARRNRADRLKRETGQAVDDKKIPNTDLVFRITTWEHIPIAPPKVPKNAVKKKKISDILEFDEPDDEEDDDPVVEIALDPIHVRVNFPPFFHYRIDKNKQPFLVGKSHWKGDLVHGEYSRDHGTMTPELARMFLKLCERYATRSNWRGYTYNEEMRGQALLQLSQIGLQFNESKSQNPFAYYTAAITNSFTRILNIEKKNQNIRDDILEQNGLNPSWTRQNSKNAAHRPGEVTVFTQEQLQEYVESTGQESE